MIWRPFSEVRAHPHPPGAAAAVAVQVEAQYQQAHKRHGQEVDAWYRDEAAVGPRGVSDPRFLSYMTHIP